MREKLIELIKLSDACLCDLCGEKGAIDRVAGVIADNLLANGVTIQKWTPASESPKSNGYYFVLLGHPYDPLKYARIPVPALWYEEKWSMDDVTHWMPLPEAPKGE